MASHLSQIAGKENISIEAEALTTIARRSNGGLRDALSLLDQVSLLGGDEKAASTEDVLLLAGALSEDSLLSISEQILKEQGGKTLSLLQNLLAEGREAHLIAGELAKHMLNVAKASYISQANNEKVKSAKDELDNITGSIKYKTALLEQAKLVERGQLIQMIEELDRLEVACRRSTQPVINLEIGLLALSHRLDIIKLQSLQARLERLENGVLAPNPSVQQVEAVPAENKTVAKTINSDPGNHENSPQPEPASTATQNLDRPITPEPSTESGWQEESKLDKVPAEENNSSNLEIETIWQKILAELQRRHLPTFSLVSTHAFPVSLTNNTLTIGVSVENFQKMIENKIEHIKVAATACQLDSNLHVSVKVIAQPTGNQAARTETKTGEASLAKLNQETKEQTPTSVARRLVNFSSKEEGSAAQNTENSASERQNQTAVQEAYRLFEGPGSRFIAPNQ